MRKAALLLVALALAMFGLVACGGDDDDDDTTAAEETVATETTGGGGGGGGGGEVLALSAPEDGSLEFDTNELTAPAGPVTIELDNPATLSHDVRLEDDGGNDVGGTDLVAQGKASASLDLTAGTYTYFCSVPGHREGGMQGTLTVN